MSRLTLHYAGPFRVSADDAPVDGLSRRGQALLAYLGRQPAMRAERATLADLLWTDRAEEQARASLRQELLLLRRTLGNGWVIADRQAVWLALGAVDCAMTGDAEFMQGFDLRAEGFEDWLRLMRQEQTAPTAFAAAQTGARPVLAVLPFEALGTDPRDMMADGVVEEITGALSRIGEFDVIARQSVFALRDREISALDAAARLGAEYLVEGSVRRAGERIRISVQLVRGSDGVTLWSDRFDDCIVDLFDMQDRIAAQVAGQISPSLRAAEIARAGACAPQNRTAYELTLTALPLFWAHRKEANAEAIERFDAALMRDREYGPALAHKAWALAQMPVYMWARDPTAAHASAAEALLRAAPHVGEHAPSLVALGAATALTTGNIPRARSYIDHALRLDPNNAWGWLRVGWNAIYSDTPERGIEAFDRFEMLSPLDPFRFNGLLGRSVCHRMRGEFDRSVALIQEGLAANPGMTWAYRMLVGDLTLAGRKAEAQEAIATFRRYYPHVTLSYLRACWPPQMRNAHPNYVDAFAEAGIPEI